MNTKDLKDFHHMTRPLKFRRLRIFFQSVRTTYEVGKDKMCYLFNYILYKINILNRFNYRTMDEVANPVIEGIATGFYECVVRAKQFVCVVTVKCVDRRYIDQDYFYYTDRKWQKHRTYTMCDTERHDYVLTANVTRPGLFLDGKEYMYGELPRIMRIYKEPEVKPFAYDRNAKLFEKVEPQVVSYDLGKLFNIRAEIRINTVSKDTVRLQLIHGRDNLVNEIKRYLIEKISLTDLEV